MSEGGSEHRTDSASPIPQTPRPDKVSEQERQTTSTTVEKFLPLSRIYYKVGNVGAFRGPKALYDSAKSAGLDFSLKDCREFLRSQPTYTLYKPARRNYPRNPIQAYFVGEVVQIDIMDMQKFKNSNRHLYVILAYDTYSKYLMGVPLLNRQPAGIMDALLTFLNGPLGIGAIYWDKEGSFLSRVVQEFLKEVGVHNYTTTSKVKAPGVERVIRTIRMAVQRYFHANKTEHWESFLPEFITAYNNRKHSSTGEKPLDVVQNSSIVLRQAPGDKRPTSKAQLPPVGSFVRLNRLRQLFEKEATGTWTSEVFKVAAHITSQKIPMIRVVDLTNEVVRGSLYPEEYQSVTFEDSRIVSNIHQIRRHPLKPAQYLVSFVGYPSKYVEWITGRP